MRSPNSSRESGLDTLRATAIVAVMMYHTLQFLPESVTPIGEFGWMGVDLFFVLSGYLIGSQALQPYASALALGRPSPGWPSIAAFYRRRAFRILPAYLVVVALYAELPAWREFPGFGPLWKFLTFTENLSFNPDFRAFSHVWSLCVEEHFYLLLPLLAMWVMRRPSVRKTGIVLAAAVFGGILLRGYAITHTHDFMRILYYPTWMRLDGLIAGVALAIVRVFRPGWWAAWMRRGHTTLAAGLALTGFVCWLFRDDGLGAQEGLAAWGMVVGLPLFAAGLGLIVASSVSRNGALSRIRIPAAKTLATLAFALYLTHKAVVHLDRALLPSLTSGRDLRAAPLYLASCLAVAALLHLCVERPFMRLRDRFDGRRTRAIEAQMAAEPAI